MFIIFIKQVFIYMTVMQTGEMHLKVCEKYSKTTTLCRLEQTFLEGIHSVALCISHFRLYFFRTLFHLLHLWGFGSKISSLLLDFLIIYTPYISHAVLQALFQQ